MDIQVSTEGDVSVVVVKGKLDALTGPEYERQLLGLIEAGGTRLVVDCSGLAYVSSAGLRALLNTAKPLQARGGELAYFGLQESVQEIFDMTGLLSLFTVVATKADALSRVGGG